VLVPKFKNNEMQKKAMRDKKMAAEMAAMIARAKKDIKSNDHNKRELAEDVLDAEYGKFMDLSTMNTGKTRAP
jgi:hypothetical protein